MIGIETVALMNPIAAGVAGLIASLHCVCMCGPLGCSVLMVGGSERRAGGLSVTSLEGLFRMGR